VSQSLGLIAPVATNVAHRISGSFLFDSPLVSFIHFFEGISGGASHESLEKEIQTMNGNNNQAS
jgi:hypothetical protein